MRIFLVAGFCIFLNSCGSNSGCVVPKDLWDSISGDPGIDAEASFNNGGFQHLGVYSITASAPGLEMDVGCLRDWNAIVFIEGTTDALCSDEHQRFNERARVYATNYNLKLNELLGDASHRQCQL